MSVSALFHIAYRRTRRADDRMLSRLMKLAGLCPLSPLGGEVEAMLRQRMSDCRDLFALRGVRPKRLTVLQLTGRRVAQDAECFEQIARLSGQHGPTLLRAICALMEMVGQSGFPKMQPAAPALVKTVRPAAVAETAIPQAANDLDPIAAEDFDGVVVAFRPAAAAQRLAA